MDTELLRVAVAGDGTLAEAISTCCRDQKHLNVVPVGTPADVVWVAYDTPLDEAGADVGQVMAWIVELDRVTSPGVPFLVSSQVPVGTCARLERAHPGRRFGVCPENVRAATAAEDFRAQNRIIIGLRDPVDQGLFERLVSPFTNRVLVMSPESAEMVKHAVNGYLALLISFINEIADICEVVGADADDVSRALRMERRVSASAPLRPGAPYGGGHLTRDVTTLTRIGDGPLLAAIKPSNDARIGRQVAA